MLKAKNGMKYKVAGIKFAIFMLIRLAKLTKDQIIRETTFNILGALIFDLNRNKSATKFKIRPTVKKK